MTICRCDGSDGCMCMYDPECNPGLKVTRYVPACQLKALKARLRQEVDAHRMTLHEHALPMSDEEFDELLAGIPGLEEGR